MFLLMQMLLLVENVIVEQIINIIVVNFNECDKNKIRAVFVQLRIPNRCHIEQTGTYRLSRSKVIGIHVNIVCESSRNRLTFHVARSISLIGFLFVVSRAKFQRPFEFHNHSDGRSVAAKTSN